MALLSQPNPLLAQLLNPVQVQPQQFVPGSAPTSAPQGIFTQPEHQRYAAPYTETLHGLTVPTQVQGAPSATQGPVPQAQNAQLQEAFQANSQGLADALGQTPTTYTPGTLGGTLTGTGTGTGIPGAGEGVPGIPDWYKDLQTPTDDRDRSGYDPTSDITSDPSEMSFSDWAGTYGPDVGKAILAGLMPGPMAPIGFVGNLSKAIAKSIALDEGQDPATSSIPGVRDAWKAMTDFISENTWFGDEGNDTSWGGYTLGGTTGEVGGFGGTGGEGGRGGEGSGHGGSEAGTGGGTDGGAGGGPGGGNESGAATGGF